MFDDLYETDHIPPNQICQVRGCIYPAKIKRKIFNGYLYCCDACSKIGIVSPDQIKRKWSKPELI